MANWDTQLEALDWIIGTEALPVTLSSHKRYSRRVAPVSCICVSEVGVAARWFFHACLPCCASEGGFVIRLLASFGMPHIAAGDDCACRMASPGRRLALGSRVHGDLEFWMWLAQEGLDTRGGTF